MTWGVVESADEPLVDVMPEADEIAHEFSDSCACLPRHERVTCTDGADGWIRIHHSWDERTA